MAEFLRPPRRHRDAVRPGRALPPEVETTREELRARFRAGAAVRRYRNLRDVVIHETADPGVVIAEYALDGEL